MTEVINEKISKTINLKVITKGILARERELVFTYNWKDLTRKQQESLSMGKGKISKHLIGVLK